MAAPARSPSSEHARGRDARCSAERFPADALKDARPDLMMPPHLVGFGNTAGANCKFQSLGFSLPHSQFRAETMAAAEEEQMPCPPTYRFRPTKRELVELYLLPRARGQDPFPGVIIEDDAAGSTLPWDLLDRHGLGSEDQGYFLVRGRGSDTAAKKPGNRQDRRCDGGVGVWKMQKSYEKNLCVRGERITCRVSNLNLHMGKGKNSGSVGWVMHEYTIAAPPCPSLAKICHIAFTGYGRMRMRVPAGQPVVCYSGHACVDAKGASSGSALSCSGSSAMLDHSSSGPVYASGSRDQEPLHQVLTDDHTFPHRPLLDNAGQYPGLEEHVPTQQQDNWVPVPTTEQQDIMVPPPKLMVQEPTMAEQLDTGELEFWASIGIDVNAEQQLWSWAGVESNLVPNIGTAMAGGHNDLLTNCAVPDFGNTATGTPSGAVLGGGSLICM